MESMESMTKAVLYARVSTDKQREEATIESQLFELKRQIATAGHTLVKEYVDDGHSGAYLDRPGLDSLRADLKTDAFEVVYFLCADRIAREPIHQRIIVSELLKHKKRIIISGKDYEENPENKFALTVLGAVAEFERAKIAERMRRGRLHRLRMGQLTGHGFTTYGYTYLKRTPTSPAALVVNDEQAKIVRWIFDAYTSGLPLVRIARTLEERGVLTCRGKRLWKADILSRMLKSTTYTGVWYVNRHNCVSEPVGDGQRSKAGKRAYRDRDEWITLRVPAIVSQELFDKAQERQRASAARYRKPRVTSLLSGFVQCGVCGRSFSSTHSYGKALRPSGRVRVYYRAQYVCNKTQSDGVHHHPNSGYVRCRNGRIAKHLLDEKVMDMIGAAMFDPEKFACCVEFGDRVDDPDVAREFARIVSEINGLDEKRRRLIELYATERTTYDEYAKASHTLDDAIVRLNRDKAQLAKAIRNSGQADLRNASIRQFCATARARFDACADLDTKREFMRDHVERVIFNHGKIAIVGFVPVQSTETKLPFRIEGEIDRWAIRSRVSRAYWHNRPSPATPATVPTSSI
jgi:site-specific DNA recombinase